MTWAFIFFNSDFCWWYRSYYCLKRQLHLLLYHDGCWGYTSVFWWEKLLDDICIHGCLCPDPISTYLNQLCQLHSYWPCLSRIDHFESKRQNLSSNLEHGILENSQFLANVIFQIDKCKKSTIFQNNKL